MTCRQPWRGFAEYLKKVIKGAEGAPSPDLFDRYLAYAAAFGLLNQWVKTFGKRGDIPQPAYFEAEFGAHGFEPLVFMHISQASASTSGGDGGGWSGGGDGGASGGGSSGAG